MGFFAPRAKLEGMKAPNFLRVAREQAGMTLEAAAARLARSGVDLSPGQLSRLERGLSDTGQERLKQLGRLYGWTAAELLAGRGGEDERMPRARMVPLIDKVQAGHWTEVADPYAHGEPLRWVPAPSNVGPRAFALELDGTSMLPDFKDKDVVIIDPDLEPKPGDFVAARIDEDNTATFKRYRVKGTDRHGRPIVELVPLNPDWPTLSMNAAKGGRIVGVATDHLRRLV
jgi:SOS-response transcriptional repressor LexA